VAGLLLLALAASSVDEERDTQRAGDPEEGSGSAEE
jgi:hypothetical protein